MVLGVGKRVESWGFGVPSLARRVPSGVGGAGSLDLQGMQRFDPKVPKASSDAQSARIWHNCAGTWHFGMERRVPRAVFRVLAENLSTGSECWFGHRGRKEHHGSAFSGTLNAAREMRALPPCEKIHNLFAAPAQGA
jgi:hypothetical protein